MVESLVHFSVKMSKRSKSAVLPVAPIRIYNSFYNLDYISMIQGITEFSMEVLCITDNPTLQEQAEALKTSAIKTEPTTFGVNFHSEPTTPERPQQCVVRPEVDVPVEYIHTVTKTPSLLHTEASVYAMMNEQNDIEKYDLFGSVFRLLHKTQQLQTLGDVIDMMAGSEDADIRMLYLHVASIVAFQHYIRVEVHRNGTYKAKRTVALLEEYKNVLIHGLLNTRLNNTQMEYMEKWQKHIIIH